MLGLHVKKTKGSQLSQQTRSSATQSNSSTAVHIIVARLFFSPYLWWFWTLQ